MPLNILMHASRAHTHHTQAWARAQTHRLVPNIMFHSNSRYNNNTNKQEEIISVGSLFNKRTITRHYLRKEQYIAPLCNKDHCGIFVDRPNGFSWPRLSFYAGPKIFVCLAKKKERKVMIPYRNYNKLIEPKVTPSVCPQCFQMMRVICSCLKPKTFKPTHTPE